jgi:hypothetical protein
MQQVIALLMGVDVFGQMPESAYAESLRYFEANYRVFPGVLKNAGLDLRVVPVSNLGFGNRRTATERGQQLGAPPNPYNVLEPLRHALPLYRPWWRRLMARSAPPRSAKATDRITDNVESSPAVRDAKAAKGTAFLSYRREGGADTARLIRRELQERGWRVFLDVDDLAASHFDDRLLLEIKDSVNFILVLSPGCLGRCREPGDWVRREVTHAIRNMKNIVPVLKDGFEFPMAEQLPESLNELSRYNCVEYSHTYFAATMDKIEAFLKTGMLSP